MKNLHLKMDIDEVIEMDFLALNALNLCNIKKERIYGKEFDKTRDNFSFLHPAQSKLDQIY